MHPKCISWTMQCTCMLQCFRAGPGLGLLGLPGLQEPQELQFVPDLI